MIWLREKRISTLWCTRANANAKRKVLAAAQLSRPHVDDAENFGGHCQPAFVVRHIIDVDGMTFQ